MMLLVVLLLPSDVSTPLAGEGEGGGLLSLLPIIASY
jgi:hypothetical protein